MIKVEKLKKSFSAKGEGSVIAVNDVSFEAKRGRIFAVLGPNGSGKTTLLRMLSSLLSPDSGHIEVEGLVLPKYASQVRAKLGFLTGSAALHKKLTTNETLELFGDLHGLNKSLFKQRRSALVEQLAMEDILDKLVGTLSMGQKQRVMIARTLLHDPEVVIFDEATSGLDVLAARMLMDMIRHCRESNKTVLFSTHIMGEVALLADDILVLHKGNVLYNDTFAKFEQEHVEKNLEEAFVKVLERGMA